MSRFKEFIPKSYVCFKEGYSKELILNDLFAGVSVGIIALPLALAFAIASGVAPEKGLFTAIVAGFLISLLGGSRVQIGGPTGAFVVIVYAIVQKHGYDGLAVATLLGGAMMILMGIARMGLLLKFIPYPVTTGFTTGIAVVIFSSQIKDFLGIQTDSVPPKFLEKCLFFCQEAHTWNPYAFAIAMSTLVLVFALRRLSPRAPGALIAVIIAGLAAYLLGLPVETIETKFGEIPQTLPSPALPRFSFELVKDVFPEAITIALLGAIESLLSAAVADGMTGHKHRSNCELVAQGLANIGSIFFGGITATGAIARTTANIKMGAKTPLAGMVHAITLLILMLFFAPLAAKIPLAALAGILVFVAWNMSELPHFVEILRGQRGDAAVLLITFLLTVLIDLTVAVQVGILLSGAIFLKRMTDKTTVEVCRNLVIDNENESAEINDDEILFRKDVPKDVQVFEINGPFFYSVADLLDEALAALEKYPKAFLLRVGKVPLFDSTGLRAIKQFSGKCRKHGIRFILSDVSEEQLKLFNESGVVEAVGKENIFSNFSQALNSIKY